MLRGLRKKASILSLSSNSQHSEGNAGDSESYNKVLKQVHDFEIALQAMDFLLDDRTPEGVQLLKEKLKNHEQSNTGQPAAIFPLALGVMEFIEATLGFEPEIMSKAHNTLSEAEAASLNNSKYNAKHRLGTSHIYPPGTEFQVTYAESTLLNALLMLLQENNGMVENAKALYKLRKAYHMLDSTYKKIKDSEPIFSKNLEKFKKESNNNFSSVDLPGFSPPSASDSSESIPQDIKLMKNLEAIFQMRKARIEGTNLGNNIRSSRVNLFDGLNQSSTSIQISRSGSCLGLGQGSSGRFNSTSTTRSGTPYSTNNGNDSIVETDKNVVDEDEADDCFSDAFQDAGDFYTAHVNESSCNDESVLSLGTDSSTANGSSDSNKESNSDNQLHVSTVDEFIHSGVQLCFGILQVVLSLIPPAIGKVLSIVGFRGDREIGLKMLWRTAITSRNIHGELALLCLLVFYDGPVQFIDDGYQLPDFQDSKVSTILAVGSKSIVTDSELDIILKNPSLYTPQILARARKNFPHSPIWVLEEGRILAGQGKLRQAIDTMQNFTDDPDTKIQMQQAEALLLFDRAMLYSFTHEFDKAAEDFIRLVDLNSWSKGLYLFMAGCAYLAKWRSIMMGLIEVDDKDKELKKYSDLAELYMKKGPTYVPGHGVNATNKKGGIGGSNKQMPFDKFLLRKMSCIEARQNEYPHLSFVECVGTSPFHELIYFWNGYNRMSEVELNWTIKVLGYSGEANSDYSINDDQTKFAKIKETTDEAMIRYFLQGIALRSLNKLSEGLALIDNHVISKYVISNHPQFKFTKLTYSPYLYPTALYERAMFVWLMRSKVTHKFNIQESVIESKKWLKKAELVADIGDYELSNRTGMRIKAAGDRLDHLAKAA